MAQFRRSIQSSGFRPEQVSNQNINQLQAYSDRITNALREERDAVISNRNRTADALKENAQIEERQLARNTDIQNQNIETRIREQTLLSEQSRRDFETRTQASKEILGNLADLSLTATLKLQKLEVERYKEQWNNDLTEIMLLGENSPKYKQMEAVLKEAEIEEVKSRTEIAKAQEKGLNPIEGARLSKNINDLSPGIKLGYLYLQSQKYQSFLNEQFMDGTTQYTDDRGVFTGVQAARDEKRAGIVAAASLKKFLDLNKITGVNPAFLQKSGLLPTILAANQNAMNVAGKAFQEDYKIELDGAIQTAMRGKSGLEVSTAIENLWPEMVRVYGFGGALDKLQSAAITVDAKANAAFDTAGILAAKVGPNGEAFGDYWPKRQLEIQSQLTQAKNAIYNQEQATKQRVAEQEWEAIRGELDAQLAAAGPQEDLSILETAEQQFYERNGIIPRGFAERKRQILEENKQETQEKAALVLEKIRLGTATRGDVESISDPTIRTQIREEFNKTTLAASFGEDYKETTKLIDRAAKQIMGDSLEGSGGWEAGLLAKTMKDNFARDYKEGLRKFNGDGDRALQYATDILQRDKDAAMLNKDPTARYYSVVGPGNQKVFKNVKALQNRTAKRQAEIEQTVRETIANVGVRALDTPGFLGTEQELRMISDANKYGDPLVFTPQIKQASKDLGISPLEATNAAIAAYNRVNRNKIEPLVPDASLRQLNRARPATLKLFTDNPSLERIRRGAAEIDMSALRDPGNLRGGSGNIGAFRAAIIGKESGGNYNAVNPDSGALGIGQVMPENVGPWTQKYLGRRLTPQQFLKDPKAQDAVINGRFRDMLNDQAAAGYKGEEAIRRAAAVWYSGQGKLWNDTRPQYSNGRRYPSIAEYTKAIYDAYRRQL
jgi:hypothetical protein